MARSTYIPVLAFASAATAVVFLACSEPSPSFAQPEVPGQQVNPEIPPAQDAGQVVTSACDGGTPECGVSFAETLYPKLSGAWGCSHSGCHGDGTFPPTIAVGDAMATYQALVAYTHTAATGPYANEPFILPCSKDPTQSTFLCSVSAPTCGVQQMPLATYGAQPLGNADLASISAWIACGSPSN